MIARVLPVFLWLSVFGWGVGLGAKLFDLVVVAGAWSKSPPASFALLPYGEKYPIDPGDFFIPLSAVMAIGLIGALVAVRKNRLVRPSLWIALVCFLLIWAATPTIFWPMIHELWGISKGRIAASDSAAIALAHRWLLWDWARVVVIATGFAAVVRALCLARDVAGTGRPLESASTSATLR